MKLVVLGSGGYHPSERRHTACYFFPESGLLLDCGTGAFRLEQFLPRDRLTILLSHGHLDHVVGLTYLLGFQSRGVLGEVDVYALPEVLTGIREHLFSSILFPVLPQVSWRALSLGERSFLSCGVHVLTLKADHRGPTANFLLEWPDKRLAYLTDTTVDGSRQHARELTGVDLLLHECYFPDGYEELARQTGHSCLGEVVRFAGEIAARRLVLIHLNPLADTAEKLGFRPEIVHTPPTVIAEDMMQIEC